MGRQERERVPEAQDGGVEGVAKMSLGASETPDAKTNDSALDIGV